jgi:hypothetical protein
MKRLRKIGIRSVLFLSILMVILIPLLSSPVAAIVYLDKIGVSTDNSAGGPQVIVATVSPHLPPGTYTLTCDGSGTFTVKCDCYCIDRNGAGTGSDHFIEVNIYRFSTGKLYTSTYSTTLNPNTQISPYPTQITCSAPYSTGSPTEQFSVYVYAYVEDLQTTNAAWNTWYWTVWV